MLEIFWDQRKTTKPFFHGNGERHLDVNINFFQIDTSNSYREVWRSETFEEIFRIKKSTLCSSIDDSCFENMGMLDHIIAQVRNVARSKSRKPNLSDCIDQGLSKHQLTKSIATSSA